MNLGELHFRLLFLSAVIMLKSCIKCENTLMWKSCSGFLVFNAEVGCMLVTILLVDIASVL